MSRSGPSRSAGRSARCARYGRRSGRPPGSSSAGCRGTASTLPYRATFSSGVSWRSRHGWLKNTTCMRPVPSPTTASTIVRRLRPTRLRTERTATSTSASVPGSRSLTRASFVRSIHRRGYVVRRSRTFSMPTDDSASRLRSPTPRSRETSISASSRSVIGFVPPRWSSIRSTTRSLIGAPWRCDALRPHCTAGACTEWSNGCPLASLTVLFVPPAGNLLETT